MRALIVIDNLNGGGAEKILITYLQNLSIEQQSKIELLLINYEGVYLAEIPEKIRVNFIFKKPRHIPNVLFKIYRRILLLNPKILYLYFIRGKYNVEVAFREGFATTIISSIRVKNVHKISWLHTNIKEHHLYFLNRKRYLKVYENIDKVICVSKTTQTILKSEIESKAKINSEVLYNPINTKELISKSLVQSKKKSNGLNLVTVGRLDSGKNQKFLIKVVEELNKIGVQSSLEIIGEGEKKLELENYIKEKKLNSKIRLLGFKINPYPYMQKADIFIFGSLYEGLPTVLIEAITLGKKVVSTNCSGAEEVIGDLPGCRITPVNDLNSFVKAILEVMDESLDRESLVLYKKRIQEFELSHKVQRFKQLLGI